MTDKILHFQALLHNCAINVEPNLQTTTYVSSQILILDPFTTKLLSSCCKMSDLMAEKITSRLRGFHFSKTRLFS